MANLNRYRIDRLDEWFQVWDSRRLHYAYVCRSEDEAKQYIERMLAKQIAWACAEAERRGLVS